MRSGVYRCMTSSTSMLASGMLAGANIEYGQAYLEGRGDFVTPDFLTVTGHPARSFGQFATDFVAAFGGTVVPVTVPK